MDDYDKNQCMTITQKLGNKTLFSIFRTKSDLREGFPTISKEILDKFVDLEIIASKIEENEYNTKEEWISDIQSIWKLFIKCRKEVLLNAIAQEFREISQKLIFKMNENEEEEKYNKIIDLAKQLRKLTESLPKEISDSIVIS